MVTRNCTSGEPARIPIAPGDDTVAVPRILLADAVLCLAQALRRLDLATAHPTAIDVAILAHGRAVVINLGALLNLAAPPAA